MNLFEYLCQVAARNADIAAHVIDTDIFMVILLNIGSCIVRIFLPVVIIELLSGIM